MRIETRLLLSYLVAMLALSAALFVRAGDVPQAAPPFPTTPTYSPPTPPDVTATWLTPTSRLLVYVSPKGRCWTIQEWGPRGWSYDWVEGRCGDTPLVTYR